MTATALDIDKLRKVIITAQHDTTPSAEAFSAFKLACVIARRGGKELSDLIGAEGVAPSPHSNRTIEQMAREIEEWRAKAAASSRLVASLQSEVDWLKSEVEAAKVAAQKDVSDEHEDAEPEKKVVDYPILPAKWRTQDTDMVRTLIEDGMTDLGDIARFCTVTLGRKITVSMIKKVMKRIN